MLQVLLFKSNNSLKGIIKWTIYKVQIVKKIKIGNKNKYKIHKRNRKYRKL